MRPGAGRFGKAGSVRKDMKEKPVSFGRGSIRLEGRYAPSQGTRGAVIAHPHPLMGGDMDNSVVRVLSEALQDMGFSTLRFNFRGVGMSSGSYDEGKGEQDDLLEALAFLEGEGMSELTLAGYSFGAWVAAGVLARAQSRPAVLVSPPIALFPHDMESLNGRVGLIVCGDQDPYCPAGEIRGIAGRISSSLDVIPDADHFYMGREKELSAAVHGFFMRNNVSKKLNI